MSDEIRYLGDVQRLQLEPGDFIVLKLDQCISMDASARLRESLQDVVPGHKVLILTDGIDIGVLSKAAE